MAAIDGDDEWVSLVFYELALREIQELRANQMRTVDAINDAIMPLCVDGGNCCDRRAAKVLAWCRAVVLRGGDAGGTKP